MRIALCADGRSPHAQRWANGVCDRGHDVALIWMKSELMRSEFSSFNPSISHHVVDTADRSRLWKLPLARLQARRLAAELRPDLVHGLYLSGYGWIAQDFGVHPLVLSALGSDVLNLDPERRRGGGTVVDHLSARYVARRTYKAVDASDVLLTDSTSLATTLQQKAAGKEIRIIRFGVEIREPTLGARSRWRHRLGLDGDAFVLLSSRLVRQHYNIDTIIRALPLIRDTISGVTLVLKEFERFSDLDYRRVCLDLAESLGVRGALREVGELDRDDLLELHAASDLHVSVPTTDGTAVSVLEAMAAGVPVVASDVPGIDPVILRHRETAILVPPRDPKALAQAVTTLGTDIECRRRITEHALEVVRQYADFDQEMDRAVCLYDELVSGSARRRSPAAAARARSGR